MLASAAAFPRSLPPWPELRGTAPEPALARWFRTAIASGDLAPAALADVVEAAVQRLSTGSGASSAPQSRPLDAARDTVLRLLAVATADVAGGRAGAGTAAPSVAAPGGTAALTVLLAEIANAVGDAVGPGAGLGAPAAAVEDPGHAAQALVGWLRTEAIRAGATPALVREAVAAGTARALETLARTTVDAAGRAAVETASALITRGLAGGDGPAGPVALLYRPDAPSRSAAGARIRGHAGGERVLPIGEETRAPPREQWPATDGHGAAGAQEEQIAENAIEGPMQCIRRTVDALLAGDTRAFTAQWVYPACFWIDGRWLACADEAELGAFQARLLRGRRERGVTGGRILLLRVDPAGDAVALVHALMSEERIDGGVAREAATLYTAVRTASGWRVAVAVTT